MPKEKTKLTLDDIALRSGGFYVHSITVYQQTGHG